jgi:hypothetical protein
LRLEKTCLLRLLDPPVSHGDFQRDHILSIPAKLKQSGGMLDIGRAIINKGPQRP